MAALVLMPVAEASAPDQPSSDDFQPGVVLVKFKPLVFPLMADGIVSLHGYKTRHTTESLGVRQIEVTPGREAEAIASLKSNPLVEYAEPDYARHPLWVPDDAYYESDQWNLRKINMEAAWDISRGSPSIKVAVVDTGLDMTQPDHASNIVSPLNECTGNSDLSDDDGHGTHVSGIIAANTDNGIGIAGVAPNVSLMPIRVECNGGIYVSTEIDAIQYAADHGARVINVSLGGTTWLDSEQAAVNYAMSKGALVVAAAGNEYQSGNPPSYPAGYPGVVAVAATASDDTHASYSDVQPYVTVAAPGGDGADPSQWVLSTYLGSGYAYMAGTSQATPHVSGLAGLIWSVNPALTNLQVAGIITSTAVDLGTPGRDNTFGWGRIDALAALTKAEQTLPAPTPTRTPTLTPTATMTPTATATPVPGLTPAATVTPIPNTSPTATTATPSVTPEPLPAPSSTPPDATMTPPPAPLPRQAYLPELGRNNSSW